MVPPDAFDASSYRSVLVSFCTRIVLHSYRSVLVSSCTRIVLYSYRIRGRHVLRVVSDVLCFMCIRRTCEEWLSAGFRRKFENKSGFSELLLHDLLPLPTPNPEALAVPQFILTTQLGREKLL